MLKRQRKLLRHRSFLLVLVLILVGCAYSFNQSVFEKYNRVYIPLGENSTTKIGLINILAESLNNKLSALNVVKLNSVKNSDIVITTRIDDYKSVPLEYEEEKISVYQVSISINFSVKLNSGKEIFNKNIVGNGNYKSEETEDVAINLAINDAVNKFLAEIDNKW